MAQHLLNCPQISTMGQQMTGKGVPKGVGRHSVSVQTCIHGQLL
jgi:hypothetical protein